MNKSIFLLTFVLSVVICTTNIETIYAIINNSPRPFEEGFIEIGYKTIDEALNDFEQHFNQRLELPLRVPPIIFTHYLGRFNDLAGDNNDSFEVEFLNDKLGKNHYKIDVRHINHKIKIPPKYVLNSYKLKNGNEAKYIGLDSFKALVFERDNWQYFLSIHRGVSEIVTPEILVEIANSIDYTTEN